MDVLDPHDHRVRDCYLIDHDGHSSSNANHDSTEQCNSETSTNNPQEHAHKNCSNEQSTCEAAQEQEQHERLSQDSTITEANLQYSRVDQKANKTRTDHNPEQHQQQQQYGQNEYDYIAGDNSRSCCEQVLLEARMTGEDAFMPFCSETIPNNDPHRRYYTNKLYEPLKSGANSQHQQNRIHQQQHIESELHIEDHDEALSLYAGLNFIEPTVQNSPESSRDKTDFNKILEDDDDDDEANLGKGHEDSLDSLQLTSLIDSFGDFNPSPLIDAQNVDDSLGLPLYSQVSTRTNELPDSSEVRANEGLSPINGEHGLHEIDYVTADSYNRQRSNEQYIVGVNSSTSQNQAIFNEQNYTHRSDDCYSDKANDVHSTNQIYQTNNMIESNHIFDVHSSQSGSNQVQSVVTNKMNECNQVVSIPASVDQNKVSSSENPQFDETKAVFADEINSNTSIDRTEKKRSLEDETQARKSKLKKRRSTLSVAEKNKQAATNCEQKQNTKSTNESLQQMEHIKELTNRLMNDEDESLVSDNNSMKSDSSRRNPIVNHYRRRTANARERIRMREINQAFERLKKVVPIDLVEQAALESGEMSDQASTRGGRRKSLPSSSQASNQGDSVKLTKITTLRMAVSYIAKLTEILNQNPEPISSSSGSNSSREDKRAIKSAACNNQLSKKFERCGEEISQTKTKRRSRSKSKKSSQSTGNKKIEQNKSDETFAKVVSKEKMVETTSDNTQAEAKFNQIISTERVHHPVVISNGVFNRVRDQQQQQTAFISIPSGPQKQQILTTYPNQQQLLISQPIGSGQERLVTPVALAILGIPTNNNTNTTQSAANSNELIPASNHIQLVGIQRSTANSPANIIGSCAGSQQQQQQQHRTYNLQLAPPVQQQQQSMQSSQPQQVTLTLDEVAGLSVLRLANSQAPNQPMPIQFRAISNQSHNIIQSSQQQSQIITAQNVNYALRPILSQLTTNSTTNTFESPMPTNFQQPTIRICNNQQDNLISRNNNITNNINNSNNVNPTGINYDMRTQAQIDSNQQTVCNISQVGSLSSSPQFNNATFTTGMSCDQVGNMTNGANTITRQQIENNQIQISQQSLNGLPQQSNCVTSKTMFVPTSNFMTISSGNQLIHARPLPLQAQNPYGSEFQIGRNKTANLVYINAIPQANTPHQQIQQQVCILTEPSQNSLGQIKQVQLSNELDSEKNHHHHHHHHQQQQQQQQQQLQQNDQAQQRHQQTNMAERVDTPIKIIARDKMGFVTHFNALSDQRQGTVVNEANITQLVASLATSIQPQNNNVQTTATLGNSSASLRDDLQQQQQPQQQQQQPIRTYRFHNYDGSMINSHLYGSTSHTQQQQSSNKRTNHLAKHQQQPQQQDHSNKQTADLQQQVPTQQRSRQNSLSSICSTTSCSSSSVNYTSSTSGSPTNNVPVVSIMVGSSPVSCSNNQSIGDDNDQMMMEEGLLNPTSMPRSARIAT